MVDGKGVQGRLPRVNGAFLFTQDLLKSDSSSGLDSKENYQEPTQMDRPELPKKAVKPS